MQYGILSTIPIPIPIVGLCPVGFWTVGFWTVGFWTVGLCPDTVGYMSLLKRTVSENTAKNNEIF